ncbi:hypothetical protein Bca4012_079373 [Brassica carinata]
MVASWLEAELFSFLRNVVFESTSYLAGEAVQLWSITYVHSEANRCADAIARSVTRDHHYASYIEKGDPSWLLPMIRADAVGTVNVY